MKFKGWLENSGDSVQRPRKKNKKKMIADDKPEFLLHIHEGDDEMKLKQSCNGFFDRTLCPKTVEWLTSLTYSQHMRVFF